MHYRETSSVISASAWTTTSALAIARRIEGMGEKEDLASVPETLAQLEAELALVESALGNHGFRSASPADTSTEP
jgi:hypothetical protein